MDPTTRSNVLNTIIEAYQLRNRIVIKNTGGVTSFEAQPYNARLDNTYTTTPSAVFRDIENFITTNSGHFDQTRMRNLHALFSHKLSLINARMTGLFAFIILLFNRNRRIQLANEQQALTRLTQTLQRELNGPATPIPQIAVVTPPPQNTTPPSPEPGNFVIPPPPPAPPPPPVVSNAPPRPKPLYTPLRPNPVPILENEPAQIELPTDRLPNPNEIASFETYILEIEAFWQPIKDRAIRLGNMQTQKSDLESKIANLQSKIEHSQKIIRFLSLPTQENIIFLDLGKSNKPEDVIILPLLTEVGYKKIFPDQNTNSSQRASLTPPPSPPPADQGTISSQPSTPSASNLDPSTNAGTPNLLTRSKFSQLAAKLVRGDTNSFFTTASQPSGVSASASFAGISSLPQQSPASASFAGSSSPTLIGSPSQSYIDPSSIPLTGSSSISRTFDKAFTTKSMMKKFRGILEICLGKIEKYRQKLENLENDHEAIQEMFRTHRITSVDDTIRAKESYIETCKSLIKHRKGLLSGTITPIVRRAPSTQQLAISGQKQELSEADQLIVQFHQFATNQKHGTLMMQIKQSKSQSPSDLAKHFHQTFFGKLVVPE